MAQLCKENGSFRTDGYNVRPGVAVERAWARKSRFSSSAWSPRAGLMGQKIAQVFSQTGFQVSIWDPDEKVLNDVPRTIDDHLRLEGHERGGVVRLCGTCGACPRLRVKTSKAAKCKIPGVGHPIHVDGDPRCTKMFEIARECGYDGIYSRFAVELAGVAARLSGRKMPLNATGAKGAIVLYMDLTPELGKVLTMIGRTIGLMAHIIEEQQNPIAQEIWDMAAGSISSSHALIGSAA